MRLNVFARRLSYEIGSAVTALVFLLLCAVPLGANDEHAVRPLVMDLSLDAF